MENIEIKNKNIDLMSPIRIFLNKQNWGNSLLCWLVIFFAFGIINSILRATDEANYINSMLNVHKYSKFIFASQAALAFLVFGYIRIYLSEAIKSGNESILPTLDIKKMCKATLGLSIVLLPFAILLFLLLIPIFFNHSYFVGAPSIISVVLATVLIFILFLINTFAIFAECSYLKDFQIKDGFKYLKIWSLFKLGWAGILETYFKAFLIITPIAIAYFVFDHLLIILQIKYFLIPLKSYYFVFDLIKFNFIAQVYRNILSIKANHKTKENTETQKNILIVVLSLTVLFIITFAFVNTMSVLYNSPFAKDFHNINSNASQLMHLPKAIIETMRYLANYTIRYLARF